MKTLLFTSLFLLLIIGITKDAIGLPGKRTYRGEDIRNGIDDYQGGEYNQVNGAELETVADSRKSNEEPKGESGVSSFGENIDKVNFPSNKSAKELFLKAFVNKESKSSVEENNLQEDPIDEENHNIGGTEYTSRVETRNGPFIPTDGIPAKWEYIK